MLIIRALIRHLNTSSGGAFVVPAAGKRRLLRLFFRPAFGTRRVKARGSHRRAAPPSLDWAVLGPGRPYLKVSLHTRVSTQAKQTAALPASSPAEGGAKARR